MKVHYTFSYSEYGEENYDDYDYEPSFEEEKDFCEYLAENISFYDLKEAYREIDADMPFPLFKEQFYEDMTKADRASFIFETGLYERFEDEAKDYFEEPAREAFDDMKLYEEDPMRYNELSWKDFL